MADYTRILQSLQELRERVDQIIAEISQSQKERGSETQPSVSAGLTSAATAEEASSVTPQQELEEKFFPPLTTGAEPPTIFGGTETSDFPDCCAVGNEFGGYFCTGTLIAPNLVVTAKHCSEFFDVTQVFLKGNDIKKPKQGETIAVVKEFNHPCADIKLLVLKKPSMVEPCHIAQGEEIKGETALVVGFGNTNAKGTVGYGKKRMAEVPIMSLSCDKEGEPLKYNCRKGIEMVAGHRGIRRDTCKGDSGGPLYIESEKGPYYMLGITSRGLQDPDQVSPKPCGNGGIYVRVDKFIDWIQQETKINIPGPLI